MAEREEAIREVEEEHDLAGLRREALALFDAAKSYVLTSGKSLDLEDRALTIVRPASRYWNPEKLMKLMPKALFTKVATLHYEVDADKLDHLIRDGKIKRDAIESAFEEEHKKAYVKHTVKAADKGEAGAAEADRLKEQLGG